jgi:tRNA(Ile)-lysidine synthase
VDLVKPVREYVEEHRLFRRGARIVVGVSGGPDSLTLLHLLARLSAPMALDLHVLHVDHQIRGAEAECDADFVEAIAELWGVPARIVQVDVPSLAKSRKLALEEAARQARYTELAELARQVDADVVAVGHTADDQAETILMHLLRGSGLAGLRGMLPRAPLSDYHLLRQVDVAAWLVRPLLDVSRAEVLAYCAEHGLKPRFDRSNLDKTYFRNRLRHETLPYLETIIPGLRERLRRMGSVIAADYQVLQAQVEAVWADVASVEDGGVTFDLSAWRALPLALQRATLRRAAWTLRRSLRDVTFVQVEDAVRVARSGETGTQATLPAGLILSVGYDRLHVGPVEGRPRPPDWPLLWPDEPIRVSVPGRVALPDTDWEFEISAYDDPRAGQAWEAMLADPWRAPLDADALGEAVMLRRRRPGDRFRPQGLGGSQKVSAFMINSKIPAVWRDHIPLLVAGETVAWVCGWRVDEQFAVSDDTQRVVVACFSRAS